MARAVIYLVRHAETTWNAEGRIQGTLDAPLSARGVRQARHLVAILLALQGAPLGDYRQIRQDNGCANIIEVDGGRRRVLTLNDTRHLGADA